MKTADKSGMISVLLRIIATGLIFLSIALVVMRFFKVSGLYKRFSSVAAIREFISSLGVNAVIALIVFQILQVVVLPVPGVLAVGAAVAMFGPFYGSVYSFLGIVIGSFIAFFIGKKMGFGAVALILGRGSTEKLLDKLRVKGKTFLTLAFIFPFFPDDALCFVSGLVGISAGYFSLVIVSTRLVSIFLTAYSLNGDFIPYNTPWGIACWSVIILGSFIISKIVYDRVNKKKIGSTEKSSVKKNDKI